MNGSGESCIPTSYAPIPTEQTTPEQRSALISLVPSMKLGGQRGQERKSNVWYSPVPRRPPPEAKAEGLGQKWGE